MLIEFLLKRFNCDTVNYFCWEGSPDFCDSFEEKELRFIRSKMLTNDLRAIVTSVFL